MIIKYLHSTIPWIVGFLVIIPIVLPFLNPGLFKTHDFTQITRISELFITLSSGEIPPRWSENFGFGYGEPLFSFYAPLPYYLGVLFHFFGIPYITCVKLLFILSFYFSFVAMFFLVRHFWKPATAYAAAMLFLYVPYRAVDVYVRGSLGELYGILFIVLALLAITKLVLAQKSLPMIPIAALSISGLILSHNLMMLVGIPFIILYSGVLLSSDLIRIKSNVVKLGLSFIIGIGLSAYFIVPAVLEKQFTSVDRLTQEGGAYSQHFVYLRQLLTSSFGYGGSILGPEDGISFQIGAAQIVFLIISTLYIVIFWKKIENRKRLVTMLALFISFASIYMMSFHSAWLWSTIPFIKYLQFPWRLLSILMISIPIASAIVLEGLFDQLSQFWRVLTVILITVGLILLNQQYFKPGPDSYADSSWQRYDAQFVQTYMSRVIPDYINPDLSYIIFRDDYVINPPGQRLEVVGENNPQLTITRNDPEYISATVKSSSDILVRANIFDFPGWEWKVDDVMMKHQVDSPLPTMSFEINNSSLRSYRIEGRLTDTPIRMISNLVSLVSFAALLIIGVRCKILAK